MRLCESGGDEFLLCLGILFHGIWESKAHCFLDIAVIEVLIKWRVAYRRGSFFIHVHATFFRTLGKCVDARVCVCDLNYGIPLICLLEEILQMGQK